MDDLICSECGRPNLSEAKKCWYCQTELKRPELENEPGLPLDFTPSSEKPLPQQEIEKQEEEIPEWLARIRKKIEEDQGPEEELPFWKQKDIFGGEKKIAPKKTRESKKHRTSGVEAKKPESEKKETIKRSNEAEEGMQSEIDDLSSELPEGFTKI